MFPSGDENWERQNGGGLHGATQPSPCALGMDGWVWRSPVDTGRKWSCFFRGEAEFGIIFMAQSPSLLVLKLII